MRVSSSVLFLCLLSTVALMGFGCKEPDPYQPLSTLAIPNKPIAPRKPYVPKVRVEKAMAPEIIYLRQVLTNLANATTYHGYVQATADAHVQGELFFSKEKGVYGILTLSPNVTSEVFMNQGSVYFRAGTSTWMTLSDYDEGQHVKQQMEEVFSVSTEGKSSLNISEGAKFLDQSSDPSGCKNYHLKQTFYVPETFTQDIHICVLNDYPTRITTTIPQGTVSASFDRFNDVHILETSPLTKK